jgi:hypothetical protein
MPKRFQSTPPALRKPVPVSLDDAITVDKVRAAQLVGLCTKSLEIAVKAGELPVVRMGNRVLFRPCDLREWVASKIVRNSATSPATAEGGAA